MTKDAKPCILVIDDERGPRQSLRMLLKHEYDILLAESVDQGIDYFKKRNPDLIILDLRMPEKGGIEGLRDIRELDRDIAVIILTGYGELETAREAIHHGANEYMKKPFDAEEMIEAVARNIERTKANRHRSNAESHVEDLDRKIKNLLGQKDKLTSLGLASSAFAHDLRNPLMVVLAYVEMLAEKIRKTQSDTVFDGDDIEEYLENIEKNINRCHRLTQEWNMLGSPDSVDFQEVELERIISETARNARLMSEKKGVGLTVGNMLAGVRVMAEASLLERALFNLATNAVQAVSGRSDGMVNISLELEGDEAVIRVKDNGMGIEEDKLEWILEPLKTDRDPGAGFGLGLFITKEVVEQHKGRIEFDSTPGKGTTVTLTLPAIV